MDHEGNLYFENCAYCDKRIPYPRSTCPECEAERHGRPAVQTVRITHRAPEQTVYASDAFGDVIGEDVPVTALDGTVVAGRVAATAVAADGQSVDGWADDEEGDDRDDLEGEDDES